ncbi:MAG: endonuclease III domain-containing protein [Candidatus Aenigmarchaeota archaeon]|nr:endonuclease III domain-containing protein [Candidatus Aenigmarchaeota archaeon]
MAMAELAETYQKLYSRYGPQSWWPTSYGLRPWQWEVCVGAVLTQNTGWRNVERALANLAGARCLTAVDVLKIPASGLQALVRPAGYFRQKAQRLKSLAELVLAFGSVGSFLRHVTRERLLAVHGIGPETADCILLYAAGRPEFVVDAYTRRAFSRLGLLTGNESYGQIRQMFEAELPRDARLFNEYHALIVRLGKELCRKLPNCIGCPLRNSCMYGREVG